MEGFIAVKKPMLVVKNNLLMPIMAVEGRIVEIKSEMSLHDSPVVLTGLFLMLVSYVESMQKSVLTYYLKYQPEELPGKKAIEIDKTIITANENFHFVEHLISDVVRRMSYPQFAEVFYKTMRINKPGNESIISDIKQRRNEVIHKNLKMDFKHKRSAPEHINIDYLTYTINQYLIYLNSLKTEISSTYAKCTRLNALRELWRYTFSTPLCAVFEEFWHIDTDSDSIVGCKTVERERSLSHSEVFMLGIWRSQVSGYKVDFINMSSLGEHMQDCLYTFLKLSNDIFMY